MASLWSCRCVKSCWWPIQSPQSQWQYLIHTKSNGTGPLHSGPLRPRCSETEGSVLLHGRSFWRSSAPHIGDARAEQRAVNPWRLHGWKLSLQEFMLLDAAKAARHPGDLCSVLIWINLGEGALILFCSETTVSALPLSKNVTTVIPH